MTTGVDSGPNAYKDMQATNEKLAVENVAEVRRESAESKDKFLELAKTTEIEKHEKPKKELIKKVQKPSETEKDAETTKSRQTKDTNDTANKFQQRNAELNAKSLVLLRRKITKEDSVDDILDKVKQTYPDVNLADEALDFLLETTLKDEELHEKVKLAKQNHNLASGREITAGKNIAEEVKAAHAQGLGTPIDLREMYREITGNPRDANILFIELSAKYSYNDMVKVTKFLLHSMGAELKTNGPSIPEGKMHNIMKEVRVIQSILQVYRFFHNRGNLVRTMMAKEGLTVPKELNFENFSKVFMGLVAERYINPDKIRQSAGRLGVSDSIPGQIVAISQLRDAVRQVSVQLIYRNIEHRDDVYTAIIGALEELEEEYDESFELDNDEDAMDVDPIDPANTGEEPMDVR